MINFISFFITLLGFVGIIFGISGELIGKKSEIYNKRRRIIIFVSAIIVVCSGFVFHSEDIKTSKIIKPVIQENYPNATNYEVFFGLAHFTCDNVSYWASVDTNINDEKIVNIEIDGRNNNTSSMLYNAETKKIIKE